VRDVMSSPLADGPADEKIDPFWDLVSVDALPLRFRLIYFSIASASRSRIRVAIGDKAAAGLGKGGGWGGPGEDAENVPVDVTDDIFPELLEGYTLACELPFEYCDDEVDSVDWARVVMLVPSRSPLSEVAVVRLPPDPLRIRTVPLCTSRRDGGSGGGGGANPPHSFPRAAACANIFRRDFLLFSN